MLAQSLLCIILIQQTGFEPRLPGDAIPQPSKETRAKPFPPSPEMQKRIQVAAGQARQWAFHATPMILYNRPGQPTSDQIKAILTQAAYKQIWEAYGIDQKTFRAILRNKALKEVPFTKEFLPNGTPAGRIGFATRPWHFERTRFDETKVVVPEKIARKIGYKNPDPNAKPPVWPENPVPNASGPYADQMRRMIRKQRGQ